MTPTTSPTQVRSRMIHDTYYKPYPGEEANDKIINNFRQNGWLPHGSSAAFSVKNAERVPMLVNNNNNNNRRNGSF